VLPAADQASETISTGILVGFLLFLSAVALTKLMMPRMSFSGLTVNRTRMRLHRMRDDVVDEWGFALDRLSSLWHARRRRRW